MDVLFDKIKDIIIEKLPTNSCKAEVSISIGESLILIINVVEKEKVDENLLVELKRLYLEGTKSEEEKKFVRDITQVFLDKNFSIKSDPKTISEDPTRRYFETNLAYCILQNNAESLDTSQLERFTQNLKQRLFSLPEMPPLQRLKIEKTLKGDIDAKLLSKYELEYAELAHKLLKQDYHGLSEKACKNLYKIACNTILATLNTQFDESMPIDIYSDSTFTMGMDGRGRIVKETHDGVRTTAKGLMKSISPLPMYDDWVNPVEGDYRQEEFSPLQRSADQSGFMIESEWIQHLFSRQTQPNSNGISSTTLAQIRNIILQKRLGNPYFSTSFQEYMTVFSALMLYNSGGHSFFEIFEVLKLPFSKELLSEEPDLLEARKQDSLMYKVLYHDQHEAFEKAFQATQSYAQILLNKKLVNTQIRKRPKENIEFHSEPEKSEDNAELKSLHDAVLNSSAEELEVLLNRPGNVNVLNSQGWSPLMVAAQLGKTEHIKALLKAGANMNYQVAGYSSLELAIKSQKFAAVEVLLKEGARCKSSSYRGSIKERAPALYLACRQNDMRILNTLLDKGDWNTDDKKAAVLVALKIENMEAIKVLIERVTSEEKQKYFSGKYKFFLLNEAAALGNVQLIDEIIKLGFPPSIDVNYNELLQTSAKRGLVPTAKYLLDLVNKAQEPKPSIDMDTALRVALETKHFDMAILLIVYGARPESIPTSGHYLQSFNTYLQSNQRFDFLFTEEEVVRIHKRTVDIKCALIDRQNNRFHEFLTNLVEFLNGILPNSLRLGYNAKTRVIKSVEEVFDKNNDSDTLRNGLHMLGLFGDCSHKKSNITSGKDIADGKFRPDAMKDVAEGQKKY